MTVFPVLWLRQEKPPRVENVINSTSIFNLHFIVCIQLYCEIIQVYNNLLGNAVNVNSTDENKHLLIALELFNDTLLNFLKTPDNTVHFIDNIPNVVNTQICSITPAL